MQKDLSQGKVFATMSLFALPMLLGNVLQQAYNVVDTWVVGRFVGADALAGVGSSFTLMTFLTSILLGLCMGSGVVFSTCFGRQDEAAEYYQKSLEVQPNNPSATYLLGRLYQSQGNSDLAREYFTRIITEFPESDQASQAENALAQLGPASNAVGASDIQAETEPQETGESETGEALTESIPEETEQTEETQAEETEAVQ